MSRKDILTILRNRLFYILIVKLTSPGRHLPRNLLITQESGTLSTIVDIELACRQSSLDHQAISNAVLNLSNSMSKDFLENTKPDEIVDSNWENDIKIPEEYGEYRYIFHETLRPI